MRLPGLRRTAIFLAILLALTVSVGGGGTYIAMEVTMRPQFCNSCHNMKPYYTSWENSSHNHVACVDCHYEPGLLETFEGKFKALSQLAKYVTATEGTKPWAEVSDYSCMRSGCHSERLLEGEIQYGRIRFDHRHHLVGLERGKKLRCTSCHSQIVQGEHLTVTKSSCILCHFKQSPDSEPNDDCNTCHGPPKDEIQLGGFVFRHSEYIKRGVDCESCHGDVTRGTGEVPRERCGSCHNLQAHFDRYGDTEFLHRHHVTDHSVDCLECHTEIQHGLPSREEHYRGDCTNCHVGAHGAPAGVYRGTGGRGVEDNPGVMYLARVTCNGCHRPPFPDAPTPVAGATFKADPLACIDCHGTGFEGMTGHWQDEVRATVKRVRSAVDELHELLSEEWDEGDPKKARQHYDDAAFNLGLVLLDRSNGAHNLPYVRDLLRRAAEDAAAGVRALDPEESPARIKVGPRIPSQEGCTTLCHVGIEKTATERAFDLPFSHKPHLTKAKFDCAKCHRAEPHGTVTLEQADCVTCHHESEEPEACGKCHMEVSRLRQQTPEGVDAVAMADLDCLSCHEEVHAGHSLEKVKEACAGCHEDDDAVDYDAWIGSAAKPLAEVEALIAQAKPEVAEKVRGELAALRRAGIHHNVDYAKAAAARMKAKLTTSK
ncbi:MAG: NapC/NirT family cytochrome c [Planctomycetota bacterium]